MNFIDSIALNTTRFIRANHQDAASEKVLFYALSLMINTLLAYVITIIFCSLTGHLMQALIVITLYTLLRMVSGGLHLSTSIRCCFYSITMFIIFAHINFNFNTLYLGQAITFVSAIIFFKTAPQGIKNVSKISEKYYPLLKTISIFLVLTNFFFQSSFIAIAFLIQALHTTKLGYMIVHYIEKLLNQTLGKEVHTYEN